MFWEKKLLERKKLIYYTGNEEKNGTVLGKTNTISLQWKSLLRLQDVKTKQLTIWWRILQYGRCKSEKISIIRTQ